MRLLIIRTSAAGDVLHALPALEAIRTHLPEAHIGWLVESLAHPFVERHPAVDQVFHWPRKAWKKEGGRRFLRKKNHELFQKIRDAEFDTAIDFQGNLKSGWVAWQTGCKRRIGFAGPNSRDANGLFMTERHRPTNEQAHIIDQNLSLATALGIPAVEPGSAPDVRLPPLPEIESILEQPAQWERCVLMNPGAGWAAKQWPPDHFAALAIKLKEKFPDRPLSITIGPGEEPLREAIHDAIRERSANPDDIFQPLPILKFLQLAALLKQTSLFISGDTGPLHLAAALKVPCVALFAEVPSWRNGPYGDIHRVFDCSADQPRRPFWQTRHRKLDPDVVPLTRFTAEDVLAACRDLLQKNG